MLSICQQYYRILYRCFCWKPTRMQRTSSRMYAGLCKSFASCAFCESLSWPGKHFFLQKKKINFVMTPLIPQRRSKENLEFNVINCVQHSLAFDRPFIGILSNDPTTVVQETSHISIKLSRFSRHLIVIFSHVRI